MKRPPEKTTPRAHAPRPDAERLVRRHQRSVRGYLAFLGCSAAQLDDLVQEVFLTVLSGSFEDRGDATTRAYLRKVARSLFFKSLRRARREPKLIDWSESEEAWIRFEGDDGGDGYLEALKACLRLVGERAARVLHLRYGERLRRTSIGTQLGLSESGVKSILVRSRKRLRDCVERRLER